jgi:hypothetical protein
MVVHHFKDSDGVDGRPVEAAIGLGGGWSSGGPDDQAQLLVDRAGDLAPAAAAQFFPAAWQAPGSFQVRRGTHIVKSLGQLVGSGLLERALSGGLVLTRPLESLIQELNLHLVHP